MKMNNLEDLLAYLRDEVMPQMDNNINIIIGDTQCIVEVFETNIPIVVKREKIYTTTFEGPFEVIGASISSELLDTDISSTMLNDLFHICHTIEENGHIFENLLKKEDK